MWTFASWSLVFELKIWIETLAKKPKESQGCLGFNYINMLTKQWSLTLFFPRITNVLCFEVS
jgi:hypothetical protein